VGFEHSMRCLVPILLALVAFAPAAANAATGYHSACGVELSSDVPSTPSGPTCGTDEGDDAVFAGSPGAVTFFGENGHDTVEGSEFGDVFVGGPGNDELFGERGADYLDGGDDSDTLFGGLGDDTLRELRFGVREHLYGGPGNDIVAGGRGGDNLFGGTGNDALIGGSGSDHLYGGPGDDVLYGGPNRDTFNCGPGNDTVYRVRHSSPDHLSTGRADASIPASAGCEHIVSGDPTAGFPLHQLLGHAGNDTIAGGGGNDFLEGKGGNDRLFGGSGNDELEGDGSTPGDDLLMGGSGNDRLAGRGGNDRLYGDARSPNAGPPGNDELQGGSGRDLLVGGPGDDLIAGAYDGDVIRAGAGNDIINLLGGDTSDPGGRAFVDCGRGFDIVAINPARRAVYRGCEAFTSQFHQADFGHFFRPSSEVWPPNVANQVPAAALSARTGSAVHSPRSAGRRAQAVPLSPAPADGGASAPSISGDGSHVAFSSDASNLIAGDDNAARTDPFVRDLGAGKTVAGDARRSGETAARGGRLRSGAAGALSADGRFLVFTSNTPDLNGHVPAYAIFRRDLLTGSHSRACRAGNADAGNPVISADGRFVAFESRATNLAGPDHDLQPDIYECDTLNGNIARVSVPLTDDVNSVGSSAQPSISADGRFVAFTSDAGGLVPGDGTRAGVYWRDMVIGETRLVDVPPGALGSDGSGLDPKISADGRFVLFDSDATDLLGGGLNGRTVDVFRKDMVTGEVTLVSQGRDGSGANGDSIADSISADGNVAVFTSNASNLVLGDGNGTADVFARNLSTGVTTTVSMHPNGTSLLGPSSQGAISADGRYVAFASQASGVVAVEAPTTRTRIYRRDLATGAVVEATTGVNLRPTSLIGEPFGVNLRREVHLIAGTTADNGPIARVRVAASRSIGHGRCLWLARGSHLVRRFCGRPFYLNARVTDSLRWTLRVPHLLPRGTWNVRSQAVDATGLAERFRPGRNLTSFRLR
jgi:Ca2+-binding RTX toxin-like protein/Tol biopolymer transport system component